MLFFALKNDTLLVLLTIEKFNVLFEFDKIPHHPLSKSGSPRIVIVAVIEVFEGELDITGPDVGLDIEGCQSEEEPI